MFFADHYTILKGTHLQAYNIVSLANAYRVLAKDPE